MLWPPSISPQVGARAGLPGWSRELIEGAPGPLPHAVGGCHYKRVAGAWQAARAREHQAHLRRRATSGSSGRAVARQPGGRGGRGADTECMRQTPCTTLPVQQNAHAYTSPTHPVARQQHSQLAEGCVGPSLAVDAQHVVRVDGCEGNRGQRREEVKLCCLPACLPACLLADVSSAQNVRTGFRRRAPEPCASRDPPSLGAATTSSRSPASVALMLSMVGVPGRLWTQPRGQALRRRGPQCVPRRCQSGRAVAPRKRQAGRRSPWAHLGGVL